MMDQINVFLSRLRSSYSQQGQAIKILIPALLLLVLCCLCIIPISLLRQRSPNALPSPGIPTSDGTAATPTALFDFDFPTFTPFPTSTSFTPSPFPTLTPPPTSTQTLTQVAPTTTSTQTALPTSTSTLVPPTTSLNSIVIIAVDKREEYAEIQNFSDADVSLRGWRLVSETGNQSCDLRGTLEPGEVLRIWADRGSPGFDCRFSDFIWRNDVADPAVLYNPEGEEVSRYP